jgi:hypothetical protein
VKDLKEMKILETARAEALVEGIKGPITRQFRDRLSEFKKLLRDRHDLALATMLETEMADLAEMAHTAATS